MTMKKPYTGNQTDRCPDMGGKLCYKVCPECKFQQEFTMTDQTTFSVKTVWECSKVMQTQLMLEGNQIGIDVKNAVDAHRKANKAIIVDKSLVDWSVKNGNELRSVENNVSDAPRISNQSPASAKCSDS